MLMTPDKNYTVALFAGYVASVDDPAWEVVFSDASAFEAWLIQAQERSTFDSSVKPTSNDRILTLSTCSYEFNNARYVVLGGSAGTIKFYSFYGNSQPGSAGHSTRLDILIPL